jgi:hypothetical protein
MLKALGVMLVKDAQNTEVKIRVHRLGNAEVLHVPENTLINIQCDDALLQPKCCPSYENNNAICLPQQGLLVRRVADKRKYISNAIFLLCAANVCSNTTLPDPYNTMGGGGMNRAD